ncbi:hypothetical protein Tco_0729935 [Tanacetum coccineum]|uniref:Uncharacterized protein n=1 Tax=Tanacetum coccineum TaxID=301880 RepID=A0ABQ4YQA3_9ASTR
MTQSGPSKALDEEDADYSEQEFISSEQSDLSLHIDGEDNGASEVCGLNRDGYPYMLWLCAIIMLEINGYNGIIFLMYRPMGRVRFLERCSCGNQMAMLNLCGKLTVPHVKSRALYADTETITKGSLLNSSEGTTDHWMELIEKGNGSDEIVNNRLEILVITASEIRPNFGSNCKRLRSKCPLRVSPVAGNPFGRSFFHGHDPRSKKASWVNWNKVLTAKERGGLGVSSLYVLNRGLMCKWVWRFFAHKSLLWSRVIKAIHGPDGGLITDVRRGF